MFRLRRYRVFLICAVLIIVLVVRLKESDALTSFTPVPIGDLKDTSGEEKAHGDSSPVSDTTKSSVDVEHVAHADEHDSLAPKPIVNDTPPNKIDIDDVPKPKGNGIEKPAEDPIRAHTTEDSKNAENDETPINKSPTGAEEIPNKNAPTTTAENPTGQALKTDKGNPIDDATLSGKPDEVATPQTTNAMDPSKTVPQLTIPDRKPLAAGSIDTGKDQSIHPVRPERVEPVITPQVIHWTKQKERFPVPDGSVIHLPTGKPVAIRKIQYKFPDETPNQKISREAKLAKVKKEFVRAWDGYKNFAWLHDELTPKSANYKDPFCGWAATLVDTLDTLWIMGLEEDFEKAVEGVKKIDFTTCTRPDLQVFEITIRYLGGLLGAYDISGQKYTSLVDKAKELGEILIGVFDTPNRMPQLFYHWKPAFASQAHRADTRSNLAELGSLSVEFTRLAQVTGESKYYDAVARITLALEDWQKRGTRIKGVFPDSVDASGCNTTVPTPVTPPVVGGDETLGHQRGGPDNVKEPKPRKGSSGRDSLLLEVIPGSPDKGSIRKLEREEVASMAGKNPLKRDLANLPPAEGHKPVQEEAGTVADSQSSLPATPLQGAGDFTEPSKTVSQPDTDQVVVDSEPAWECIPQGLDSVSPHFPERFSMGGCQDSTYEYFSKEYMLLGGLEDGYRKLYIDTMAAVRGNMLYRPMAPGNPDILFSGKVSAFNVEPAPKVAIMLETEVTHLTCFLGGMVGMGAKLFDIPSDLEIAKKLTDGCVWAYSSMPSGVMAEHAQVLPCESVTTCSWNETLWWQHLDPMWADRDKMIRDYDEAKVKTDAELERSRKAAEALLVAEQQEGVDSVPKAVPPATDGPKKPATGHEPANLESKDVQTSQFPDQKSEDPLLNDSTAPKVVADDSVQPESKIQKRQVKPETPQNPGHDPADAAAAAPPIGRKTQVQIEQEYLDNKKSLNEEELNLAANGREQNIKTDFKPSIVTTIKDSFDPLRPLNHTQYVESMIKRNGLPPGYLMVGSDRYILRPEAIESVWYMYRITGDASWQEKGWKMFEAVINFTSTTYGHSAATGVTMKPDSYEILDQMESFWLAETLKYFYLLFTTPDVVSLDEWVLNTEAHPLRRPV